MTKKIFYFLSLIFILFIIIYTQILSASHDIINHDDLHVMFKSTNFFKEYFVNAYHGRFITNTIATLLGSFLPFFLDIHPISWLQTFGAGIKAFFIFIICYLLSSSLFIFDRKNNGYKRLLLCIFTLLFYFLYQIRFKCLYESMLYMSFYGFTFPFILYFFFWKTFIKYFCDDNVIVKNYKHIFFFCILSFLLGCSSEFFSFSSFCTLTLLIFFIFINKFNHKYRNYIYNIYLCFFIGLIFYILNPGFIDTCEGKDLLFFQFLSFFKEWFAEVTDGLYRIFFSDFIYIASIMFFLFIILLFLKIENKKRKMLLLILYIFGVICFYFSMSFVRMMVEDRYLYINHLDIIAEIQIALIFAIILQISFLSDYKYLKNIIIITLLGCLSYYAKENLIDTYNLIVKNNKTEYIYKYNNNLLENILNRYKCEYVLLENIKDERKIYNLGKFIDLRPNNIDCCHYIKMVYNLDCNFSTEQTDITTAEQLYEKFLSDGGNPLSQKELSKYDFDFLLKKYRKK